MPMAPRNKTVDCPKRVDAIATLMTERLWAPDGSLAHRTDQLLEIVARGGGGILSSWLGKGLRVRCSCR